MIWTARPLRDQTTARVYFLSETGRPILPATSFFRPDARQVFYATRGQSCLATALSSLAISSASSICCAWPARSAGDGCYGLHRLIEKRGRDAKLIDWLDELTVECPKKLAHNMNDPRAVPGFGEGALVLAVDALHIARRGVRAGSVPLTRLFLCKARTKRAAAKQKQLPSLQGVAGPSRSCVPVSVGSRDRNAVWTTIRRPPISSASQCPRRSARRRADCLVLASTETVSHLAALCRNRSSANRRSRPKGKADHQVA